MKVLYFAQAAQLAGCHEEDWENASPMSVAEFWREATMKHPALGALAGSSRIACGMEYLDSHDRIDPDKDVAVIPPVSGG